MAGETFRDIAEDYDSSAMAIQKQHNRSFGTIYREGGRSKSPPLGDPTLVARADQGVAGLKNWRNDPRGEDGMDRLVARLTHMRI